MTDEKCQPEWGVLGTSSEELLRSLPRTCKAQEVIYYGSSGHVRYRVSATL
jgi:hypothetical protein